MSPLTQTSKRNAFTLVEILVVITIISIMGGMVLAAVQDVTRTAKLARTRTILTAVDAVLQEQYESYRHRPLAVEIPDLFNPSRRSANEVGFEVLPDELARVRLMMTRDLQRMEMPECFGDILGGATVITAMANPVVVDSSGQLLGTRDQLPSRRRFQVSWYGTGMNARQVADNVPSKLAAYLDRAVVRDGNTGNVLSLANALSTSADPNLRQRVYENQSAECLYLIMSTTFLGGSPAIDAIPTTSIGDTDDDGLLEILDGWDRPVGFIRWPIGYTDVNKTISERHEDFEALDDFDAFQSDFAYYVPETAQPVAWALGTDPQVGGALDPNGAIGPRVKPWSMRPLVVSAGSDGEFGLTLNPVDGNGIQLFNFVATSNYSWPINGNWMGQLALGNHAPLSSTIPYPDPYLRGFIASEGTPPPLPDTFSGPRLPGQFFGENAVDVAADNITNYQLQADRG